MSTESAKNVSLNEIIWGTFLLGAGLFTYIAYAQFFNVGWTFDDIRLLKGLAGVNDIRTALDYIQEEKNISPLDRPLSMATFLLNVKDWPNHISGFRHTNTIFHIANGWLLALVSFRIALLIPPLRKNAIGFAVTLTVIWMLHPFLASTTYHIIQRMVLLAAGFSLLATLLYLMGRSLLEKKPGFAYLWMSAGLIVAGVGAFAKETAALTPLLLGVMEFTLLSYYAPVKHKYWKMWKFLFFAAPAILLLLYGVYYMATGFPAVYLVRPFGLSERLLSESLILLDYVRQILIPDISLMGPYQDDVTYIRKLEIATVMASLFWVALVSIAVMMRKRTPVFSFVVLFFIVGHLLESGIFPLELYFEHRNYLPSLGVLGGVAGFAWSSRWMWPKLATLCYAVIMGVLLWQTATLWGNPMLAHENWVEAHPTSSRAIKKLSYLYHRSGRQEEAIELIYDAYQRNPMDAGVAADLLFSLCIKGPHQEKVALLVETFIKNTPQIHWNSTIVGSLHTLIDIYTHGNCDTFNPDQVIRIARGLLGNPVYTAGYKKYVLLHVMIRVMDIQGDYQSSLKFKIDAFRVSPTIAGANLVYGSYKELGFFAEAEIFMIEARERLPDVSFIVDATEK